jgi:hypothetical protein
VQASDAPNEKATEWWSENPLALPVLLFVSFRLFAVVLLQYGGIFGGASDYDYYYNLGALTDHGAWPFLTYWSEYPPLFPAIAVGIYRGLELIGSAPPPAAMVESMLRAVLLVFDVGNLLLVASIGRRLFGKTVGARCAWVYALLFGPAFIWLGWFEPFPIFWGLLGLAFLLDDRYGQAGIATSFGFLAKVLPALLGVVVVRRLGQLASSPRGLGPAARFVGAGVTAMAVVLAPLLFADAPIALLSARSWVSRPPWETIWAILSGYASFGFVPSLFARAGWPDYTAPVVVPTLVSVGSTTAIVGAILLIAALDWQVEGPLGATALTGALYVGTFLVASGFSPQYVDWVMPFLVVLLPPVRAVGYATALTVLAMIGERYLYFWLFPPRADILLGLVAIRSLLLFLILVEFWWAAHPAFEQGRRRARRVGMVGLICGALALAAYAGRAFVTESGVVAAITDPTFQTASALRSLSDPSDAIVTLSQTSYLAFGPGLGDRSFYYLAPERVATTVAREATLRGLAFQHPTVLVIDPADPSPAMQSSLAWLRTYGVDDGAIRLRTGATVEQFSLPLNLAWPTAAPASDRSVVLGSVVELLGVSPDVATAPVPAGTTLELRLTWKPLGRISSDARLLLQLRDDRGRPVAATSVGESDGYVPAEWPPGQVVVDAEPLAIPPRAAAGTYSVWVGWSAPASTPGAGSRPGSRTVDWISVAAYNVISK